MNSLIFILLFIIVCISAYTYSAIKKLNKQAKEKDDTIELLKDDISLILPLLENRSDIKLLSPFEHLKEQDIHDSTIIANNKDLVIHGNKFKSSKIIALSGAFGLLISNNTFEYITEPFQNSNN